MQNRLINEFLSCKQLTPEIVHQLQYSTYADVHNPELLHNAREWVSLLHDQVGKKILIIPDYDTDGIMSGTLLYAALYELGWQDVHLFAPSMETGYGLSCESLDDALAEMPDAQVIITTDNGIKAFKGIERAKELGLVVLVTDHHPGDKEEPIADCIVNPNSYYDNSYPFKGICGGEVIFKLICLYASTYASQLKQQRIYNLYPFAGISAVADMMPMLDENRYFVKSAISFLKHFTVDTNAHEKYVNVFKGLWALLSVLDDNGKLKYGLDADTIGFYLSPMLNSCRRLLGSSKRAFAVFLQDSLDKALECANDVWLVNEERKQLSKDLSDSAAAKFVEYDTYAYCAFVIDAPIGFAGIVSGNVTGKFDLPTIVFADYTGTDRGVIDIDGELVHETIHGSGRAPSWFSLSGAMTKIAALHPEWFVTWGGHEQALGCEIYSRYLDDFRVLFSDMIQDAIFERAGESTLVDDFVITDDDVKYVPEYVEFLKSLEPFGVGLTQLSVCYDVRVGQFQQMKQMGRENQHLKITVGGYDLLIWYFNDKPGVDKLLSATRGDIIRVEGKLSVNEWKGRVTPQIVVDNILTVNP